MSSYKLQNISFQYQQKEVINLCELTIGDGEFVAIIGPNGSGKSTLLKIFAGLLPPNSGSIFYNGKVINSFSLNDLATIRAFLPARDEMATDFTVLETVLLARYSHSSFGFTTATDNQLAHLALKRMVATELAQRPLSSLSSGERQRVAIARLFCQNCPLLLLDEPTNFLDPTHQHLLLSELKKETQVGKTVVTVLHDLRLAAMYATRAIVLQSGHLMADLPASNLPTATIISDVFQLDSKLLFG